MSIKKKNAFIAQTAIIGAMYAALTYAQNLILPGTTTMAVQFRASEALNVLALFTPAAIPGLTLGCVISNIASIGQGLPLDMIFGSLATLITCLCIAWCGKKGNTLKARLLACLMPVVWNGLIVGATLTIALAGLNPLTHFGAFLVFAGEVALGELGVMYLIGLPLMTYLPKQRFFSEFVDKHS